MVCVAVKSNILKPDRGISGAIPYCYANLSGFFLGDSNMKCGHGTCPLLEISLIPLTQGKFAIIDTEDYDYLMQWKWCAHKDRGNYYAHRSAYPSGKHTTVRMHRFILNVPPGLLTDHANHYGLDNRKSNIRPCTNRENQFNQIPKKGGQSKYKGVRRSGVNWMASIRKDKKKVHLGNFKTEQEAAKEYDRKAKELFGEFACLNFPELLCPTP